MSLPVEIGPLTVEYTNGQNETEEMSVLFSSQVSLHRTYTADGESMEARTYIPSGDQDTVRDICLVANKNSKIGLIEKAAELLAIAICRNDAQKAHHRGEVGRGAAWPLNRDMLSGAEDGSIRPRGFAGIIRYIESARLQTTTIVLPAYLDER